MDHTGSGHLLLDDASVDHEASPLGYLRVAAEFAHGAMLANGHSPTPLVIVAGANMAHSVELALRAFLLSKMSPIAVKRAGSRHDLEKLWVEAVAKGLQISPTIPRWCRILNAGHSDPYLFRYPKDNTGVTLPGEGLAEIQVLLDTVDAAIGV